MSTPFQNRLVGTMIVAAVAIIFLPDLLDGDKKTYQEEFDKIPNAPQVDFQSKGQSFPDEKLSSLPQEELVEESAIDDIKDSDINLDENSISNVKSSLEAATVKKEKSFASVKNDDREIVTPVNTEPEKAKANIAWVVQLGTFRHKKNVDDLVNKLKSAGYTAFTKPIKTKKGNLTKVFVGPELIKSNLEKKIPALKVLTKVQGKVARFTPTR
ncbi:MAG: SPOR domain-containing protein [Colwelliaceae bacterium]|nr:SPOR domain-containing protein [Colwelliaceae bacterium]